MYNYTLCNSTWTCLYTRVSNRTGELYLFLFWARIFQGIKPLNKSSAKKSLFSAILTFISATRPFNLESFFWLLGLFLIVLAAWLTVFRGLRWNFILEDSFAPTLYSSVSSRDWRRPERSLLSWKILFGLLCLFTVEFSHTSNIPSTFKAIHIQSYVERAPTQSTSAKYNWGRGWLLTINYELYHNEFIQWCEVFAPPVHGFPLVIRLIVCFVGITDVFVVNVWRFGSWIE